MTGAVYMVKELAARMSGRLADSAPAMFLCCAVALGTCYMFLDYESGRVNASSVEHAAMKKSIDTMSDSMATALTRLADAYEKTNVRDGQLVEVLRANTDALREANAARMEIVKSFAEFTAAIKVLSEEHK